MDWLTEFGHMPDGFIAGLWWLFVSALKVGLIVQIVGTLGTIALLMPAFLCIGACYALLSAWRVLSAIWRTIR